MLMRVSCHLYYLVLLHSYEYELGSYAYASGDLAPGGHGIHVP